MLTSNTLQRPAQFFDMLENLNFQRSGSTSSIRTFGDASAAPFQNLSQLESMMQRGPSFQQANQRYAAFQNLMDSGFGGQGVGSDLLQNLFSKKTPEQLAEYGKSLKNNLMQAQMNPMGAVSSLASGLGDRQWTASGSARATAFKKDFNFATEGDWGHVDVRNQVSFLDAAASGYATAGIKDGNFFGRVGGQAGVDLMRVKTQANVNIDGVGQLDFKGDARIGAHAQGSAGVQVGKDGVHAEIGASAFAGAQAKAQGSWKSESGAQINFGASAVAGVGAEAGAKVGFKNGKLDFNLRLGLALGVGARFNVGFSLDFKKIGQNIKKAFTDPIGFVKDRFVGLFKKVKNIGGAVVSVAKKIGKGIAKVGKKVVDGIKKVGTKIKNGLQKAGKKIKNFFKKLF